MTIEYRIYPWKTGDTTMYHIINIDPDSGNLESREFYYSKVQAETRVACLVWNETLHASPEWQNGRMNKYMFRELVNTITGISVDITEKTESDGTSGRYHVNVCADVWLTYNIYGMWVEFAYFS